ncbi:MAG: hypothetical protein KatS3mg095_0395 [Candidatus Parcubacteria bacterium]|nr:MAG: hypothetical protein KatS3mg095_0395 [Candidatus Parcubacteria bacterium]
MNKRILIILGLTIVIIIGLNFYYKKGNVPVSSNSTQRQTLNNETDNEVKKEFVNNNVNKNNNTKRIMITNGLKHSVPLDEIVSGGPPKDGIPSIDNPKFVSIKDAEDFLKDDDLGIVVDLNNVQKFYPYQILVWHEIVNDKINSQRILVTYCPLCFSGIVFDPLVKGERVEFGTSGKLWNSNLVMYDRKTDSLWSQILGEAIAGEMTGEKLKILPSDIMKFSNFKKLYPQGLVLSRDTGALRFYGIDPYGDYYTTPGVYFPVKNRDNRLDEKSFVLGIIVNGKAKAYSVDAIKKIGELEDKFEGKTIIVKYDKSAEVVRIFEKKTNGSLERINPFATFWFTWVAVHPDTDLFK